MRRDQLDSRQSRQTSLHTYVAPNMTKPKATVYKLADQTLSMIFRRLLKPDTRESVWNEADDDVCKYDKRVLSIDSLPSDPRERWLSRQSFMDMRDGRDRLVPVSRVCRRWNEIANEILYMQIQVYVNAPRFLS